MHFEPGAPESAVQQHQRQHAADMAFQSCSMVETLRGEAVAAAHAAAQAASVAFAAHAAAKAACKSEAKAKASAIKSEAKTSEKRRLETTGGFHIAKKARTGKQNEQASSSS